MLSQNDIVRSLKEGTWDLRVKRPGFLQSKQIVSAALTTPVPLTSSLTVHEKSNVWVSAISLYNQATTDYLVEHLLPAAFEEDRKWPLALFEDLKQTAQEKERFVVDALSKNWRQATVDEKCVYLDRYVALLTNIQKYYVFAVPLTNYCEQVLKEHAPELLQYAVQYDSLDVDRMNESLAEIKNVNGTDNTKLIAHHLATYAWIKSNYNIIEPYTKDEVLKELQSEIHVFKPMSVPNVPYDHIATALQVGIFLRNRMKELSQQVWFAHEGYIKQIAEDLNTGRENVLQLTCEELSKSLLSGTLVVPQSEIVARHEGFVVGMLDGEQILKTGSIVGELTQYFDSPDTEGVREVRGTVASKGLVTGIARVIANMSEIGKLQDGDILITSMTTPDFIVAMKQAGAIVTDEGGLSCHAAIVSRELRKPCVIGTKIATKVFRDGEMIEVDAEKGIVKKL